MKLFDVYPLQPVTITRAAGSFVWGDDGTRYLDMYGGHAVISIGHTHPHWVKRIEDQLEKIAFYSNSVHLPIQEELASLLLHISGKKNYQLFLCNSGAEANENAMKLASFHTGRKKIIAFRHSFHGRTSLAVAATDNPAILAPVNVTDAIIFLPFNDEEALAECFKNNRDEIAAVITEGIQGVGGIRVAADSFLRSIREHCDQSGALMIADSVQCGYGRTGNFFAHDYAGISADIYTMAKGMGNGFPVAGVLIAPHIKPKHGMLGTTFGGNPLACAAALAVLEVMRDENLMVNATTVGNYLMEQLRGIPSLQQVRGRGLMIGFDVPAELSGLKNELLSQTHVFTGEAKPSVIRLLPPLSLSLREADMFLQAIQSLLSNQPQPEN
ncbi:MAG: aspartate aminotransferase family protein [Chitinophagaceae bacterium]|jgi:acetylornithine/N-succinyldiaminopimelate aminotransferase|nr:aspartate aminotransferase family protein [Chitinophagaceae bacterium]MCA6476814.1 aspartate aminotransferase family protein [Chitinophagaceae bacterium]MCA6481262.1 aspartate aminotransferase family protein [Chitinophagaceae bacterium]MCA6491159.1 aspartate aminotransferase family protein [Chitinophagaceae bacterium]MCA6496819.1 aspartate aminotransferase family protein [Chitinophagaceae bacterium]